VLLQLIPLVFVSLLLLQKLQGTLLRAVLGAYIAALVDNLRLLEDLDIDVLDLLVQSRSTVVNLNHKRLQVA
jgi:hypothetical protein